MKKILTSMALVGVAAFALTGCSKAETTSGDESGGDATEKTEVACACDAGKAGETVWCEACTHGYMGGEKITDCKGCYEQKANNGPACETCAKKKDK